MAHDDNEVYSNLTENRGQKKGNWTAYLFICCITVCLSSFIFGYNIGVTNLPTPLIKAFFTSRYNPEYLANVNKFHEANNSVANLTSEIAGHVERNQTVRAEERRALNELVQELEKQLVERREELSQLNSTVLQKTAEVNDLNIFLWTITTSLFVVGGMFGAFGSKYILDTLGRKKGILFNYIFSLLGAIACYLAPGLNSPECIMVGRFLYGIQGGATCGLIPTYLAEISPVELRGATGVLHQLCLTVGILMAQVLGFRQLLGVSSCWHYLLAVPIIPTVVGAIVLLVFFPESPKALLINNRDEDSAAKALRRLRNKANVNEEMELFRIEQRENSSDEAISIIQLFTTADLRWPLITGIVLQLAQQLCGINAIFFYSDGIFRRANIGSDEIQYAVFFTGFINVICTILVVPLIDKLGRKPLLLLPMAIMIVDFLVLTALLVYQDYSFYFSYASVVCIIIFIMCFAFGLGPIPFLYVAECFRQDARSAALAVCMFVNWTANLALTLSFEYMAKYLGSYVFLVFLVIVLIAALIILKKVPETKGRKIEEIMEFFTGRKSRYDESSGKLMANSKV